MKTITYFNEKGNALVAVRNALRTQAFAEVVSTLQSNDKFEDVSINANGGISICIAQAQDGTPIYANLSMTISTADPTAVKEKKTSTKKKAEPVEVPDLF